MREMSENDAKRRRKEGGGKDVSTGLPRWVSLGRRARWWSQSQQKFMGVVITSLDDAKKQVVVTFESDKKVWKSVPFSKLSAQDCPLSAYRSDEKAAEGSASSPKHLERETDKDNVAENDRGQENGAEAEKAAPRDGSATPDWWTMEKQKIKSSAKQLSSAKVEEERKKKEREEEEKRLEEQRRADKLAAERRKVEEAFEKRKKEQEEAQFKAEEEWREKLRTRRLKEAAAEEERDKEKEERRRIRREEKDKKKKAEQEAQAAKESEERSKKEQEALRARQALEHEHGLSALNGGMTWTAQAASSLQWQAVLQQAQAAHALGQQQAMQLPALAAAHAHPGVALLNAGAGGLAHGGYSMAALSAAAAGAASSAWMTASTSVAQTVQPAATAANNLVPIGVLRAQQSRQAAATSLHGGASTAWNGLTGCGGGAW
eukprot:TRINITY_DN39184_c0_g1_i1.p1 TRINITY_DN39184_c0_g1~~TRINITY_DN39184_c0_g1_i1.p1  ORF type:complete len:432 (-),score=146.32 TRINITY_DN39184_c0_g1_i1:62-1357(-)